MNNETHEESPKRFGYWAVLDNAEHTLDEDSSSWIQAVPLGDYKHPVYGDISFTQDKVRNMASNIKNEVRETLLDVDYDHKAKSGKAAGWITDADARSDGLYVKVEWTETAKQAIKSGEYKYFSPEYQDKWKHPKSEQVHNDVLFGGALTNRPFLKDILPVNLSELIGDQGDQTMSDNTLFVDALRDVLGLNEDASEDEILVAASQQAVVAQEEEAAEEEASEEESEEAAEEEAVTEEVPELVLASETPDSIKALAEDNPEVKALMDRVVVLETANKLSEVNLMLNEWDSERAYTIPSTLRDQARKILCEANAETVQFFDELTKVGMVPLGETPVKSRGVERTASESFTGLVEKLLSENPELGYADAVAKVSGDNAELFEEYRREAFIQEV